MDVARRELEQTHEVGPTRMLSYRGVRRALGSGNFVVECVRVFFVCAMAKVARVCYVELSFVAFET
jgi:hypothetical protein